MANSRYTVSSILLSVAAYVLPAGQTVEIECTPCYLKGYSHRIWVGRCLKCNWLLASCDDESCLYNIGCACVLDGKAKSE